MLRIISIASQKGGTGKTTTAINLGVCLAERNKRTLLIDIDPQANLTTGLGFDTFECKETIYHILSAQYNTSATPCLSTPWSLLDLIPSSLDLASVELEMASRVGREWLLKKALEKIPGPYHYIIIDTPPSLGLLTQNAFMACEEIIIPLQVHVYALRAIPQLQTTLNLVREFNPLLHISGIVCTMYDARNNLSRVVEESIREQFGDIVFKTVIPMNIAIAESPAAGKPVVEYAPNSVGAKAYRQLAEEILAHG
ncbi:MAG: AAA family ATPase [Candidatus Dadabacteria bacterium]|nr:AAA family ATPase [Candidatus Dadabacteria bacterium]NIQ16578.1 AAA family ATPase [Candidatus Dadabacteria bacterium]